MIYEIIEYMFRPILQGAHEEAGFLGQLLLGSGQNQKHFAVGILNQPGHEFDQHLAGHGCPVQHEPHLVLIDDG